MCLELLIDYIKAMTVKSIFSDIGENVLNFFITNKDQVEISNLTTTVHSNAQVHFLHKQLRPARSQHKPTCVLVELLINFNVFNAVYHDVTYAVPTSVLHASVQLKKHFAFSKFTVAFRHLRRSSDARVRAPTCNVHVAITIIIIYVCMYICMLASTYLDKCYSFPLLFALHAGNQESNFLLCTHLLCHSSCQSKGVCSFVHIRMYINARFGPLQLSRFDVNYVYA